MPTGKAAGARVGGVGARRSASDPQQANSSDVHSLADVTAVLELFYRRYGEDDPYSWPDP
jgi:hypothetical protein